MVTGLAAWGFHIGVGREVIGLGVAPKAVEVASLPAPTNLAGRPSLAVLPFENLSDDSGQDFFSNGITEDVITALGRFSNLLVVAKSASFQFKGRNIAPPRSASGSTRAICSTAVSAAPATAYGSMQS